VESNWVNGEKGPAMLIATENVESFVASAPQLPEPDSAAHEPLTVASNTEDNDVTVTVTPAFRGINIRVSGRDRNDIKDYIYESFDMALCTEIEWDKEQERWYSPELRQAAARYQDQVAKGEIS